MFLVNSDLIVISQAKIYKVLLQNCPVSIEIHEIFGNFSHAQTEKKIRDVIYSQTHNSFYLLLRNKNDEESIVCKFLLGNPDICKTKVGKNVNRFEISSEDPLSLFLICDKEVLHVSMDRRVNKQQLNVPRKSAIGENLKKKIMRKTIHRSRSKVIEDENHEFKRIYSNPKNKIEFFKFDKDMRFFYTHDDKVIKKYLYETSTLVQSFEGHTESLKNLMFTNNFSYMIRYRSNTFF